MARVRKKLLDTRVFDRVIELGSVAQRRRLAEQLCDLMCQAPELTPERREATPALLSLASDREPEIRRLVADRLRHCPHISARVVFAIAAVEEEIALDFLNCSPALDERRMLAVLHVGDVSRQRIIASRDDLTCAVVDELVRSATPDAVLALLENPAAPIAAHHCRRLYGRFAENGDVVERLLVRDDLPPEVRIEHARRTSHRMMVMLDRKGWMPRHEAASAAIAAQEAAFMRILADAPAEQMERALSFMSERKLLTAQIVMRAACRGELKIVEHALAFLAGMPHRRVHTLIHTRGSLCVRAIHNRAGMPARTFHLLRAAFDIARDHAGARHWPSPQQFGRLLMETVMTRYDMLAVAEKIVLLDLIAALCDEHTRAVASRLSSELRAAA